MGFKFEQLEVWNRAIELADEIHQLTKVFLKEEMFSINQTEFDNLYKKLEKLTIKLQALRKTIADKKHH